jgi:hypothetical protein
LKAKAAESAGLGAGFFDQNNRPPIAALFDAMMPNGSAAISASGGRRLPQRLLAQYKARSEHAQDPILRWLTIFGIIDIGFDQKLVPGIGGQFVEPRVEIAGSNQLYTGA